MSKQTLSIGHRGEAVAKLQRDLRAAGYPVAVNGVYSQQLVLAMRQFQLDTGRGIDGTADITTQEILEDIAKKKSDRPVPPTAVMSSPFPETAKDMPPIEFSPTPVKYRAALKPGVENFPGVVVVMLAHTTKLDDAQRCLNSIEAVFTGYTWALVIIADDWQLKDLDSRRTSAEFRVILPSEGGRIASLNAGLNHVKTKLLGKFPILCPVDARDEIDIGHVERLLPIMAYNDYPVVYGDWLDGQLNGHYELQKATDQWPILEKIRLGSILFRGALLTDTHKPFPEEMEANADLALWLAWHVAGIKMVPVSGRPVMRRYPRTADYEGSDLGTWGKIRHRLFESCWSVPKVSALLLTGKCPERYPLARVAVRCFLNQTWSNKELVIINHGQERVWSVNYPRIRELMVTKPDSMTLGDLRNLSIENATGDYCIQWDDDDWHHPTRMANQMKAAAADTLVTFNWQVRCNMNDGTAFYDRMPKGQQMSVLFPCNVQQRYQRLNVREDTEFFKAFEKTVSIDNHVMNTSMDPFQYIRFYHGRNIWDVDHVMNGSLLQGKPKPGMAELTPFHQEFLSCILTEYRAEPGFSALP